MNAVSEYNDTDFFDRRRVNCDIVNTLRRHCLLLSITVINSFETNSLTILLEVLFASTFISNLNSLQLLVN